MYESVNLMWLLKYYILILLLFKNSAVSSVGAVNAVCSLEKSFFTASKNLIENFQFNATFVN